MLQYRLSTPGDFSFHATANSHGWRDLLPFSYNHETQTLSRVQQLADGSVIRFYLHDGDEDDVIVMVDEAIDSQQQAELNTIIARCLTFDWDLRAFYDDLRGKADYVWVERDRVGRMLISPTVWEDLVKTLLTTNTTWSQTKAMSQRLCTLGAPYQDDLYAFPTPEQVAALSYEALHERVRAGYRSAYLYELASVIVQGQVDVEAWHGPMASDDLYKAVRARKGFGDYAAGTMLRLLGHFDRLAIDTACRSAHAVLYNSGEKADDKTIRRDYAAFGRWQGLVMWLDIMRS